MNVIKELLERLASWPEEDVEKLADAAHRLETWRNAEKRTF
jgi:hypothetical protein